MIGGNVTNVYEWDGDALKDPRAWGQFHTAASATIDGLDTLPVRLSLRLHRRTRERPIGATIIIPHLSPNIRTP